MATLYLEEKESDASSFDLFVFVTLQAVKFRSVNVKKKMVTGKPELEAWGLGRVQAHPRLV